MPTREPLNANFKVEREDFWPKAHQAEDYAPFKKSGSKGPKTKSGGFFKSAKKGFKAFGKGVDKTARVTGNVLAEGYKTSARAKTVYHEKRTLGLKRRQEIAEYKANLLNLKSQRAAHKLNIQGSKYGILQQKKLIREEQPKFGIRGFKSNIRKSRPGPLSDKTIKRKAINPVTGKPRNKGGFFS